MIVKNKNQRVAVLVDVQNLYYSARNLYGARISFKNLLDVALAERVLTRAIAYVIKADVTNGEGDFFSAVHDAGFEVKEKELQVFPGGAKKGDWDLGIAMDAIRLGTKVDSIVLVSGDGDYVPVVSYLQQSLGCLVEVVAFDKTCSKSLREVADDFIAIEDHSNELLFKTEKSTRTAVVGQRPSVPQRPSGMQRSMMSQSSSEDDRGIAGMDERPILAQRQGVQMRRPENDQQVSLSSQRPSEDRNLRGPVKRSGMSSFRPQNTGGVLDRGGENRLPSRNTRKILVGRPLQPARPVQQGRPLQSARPTQQGRPEQSVRTAQPVRPSQQGRPSTKK